MSLFGKKETKGIKVSFYEGDLPGFITYKDVIISLSEEKLYLTQIKPQVEVSLDRNRVINVESLCKENFMQKYKGNEGMSSQKSGMNEGYHVFTYLGKDGAEHRFVLYAWGMDDVKMLKLKNSIISQMPSSKYEL